jgi:hypothetical protein
MQRTRTQGFISQCSKNNILYEREGGKRAWRKPAKFSIL